MTHKERIFHMVLFEALALLLLTLAAIYMTGKAALSMGGLAVGLSLIAMVWSYLYNLGYDHYFGADRSRRKIAERILHGLAFELGMVILSFPVIMYVTQLDLLSVFLMDMGVVLFFLVYAVLFNWAYDIIRKQVMLRQTSPDSC
ncbi:PACE efflux transporter [Thalassomonas haliotis]|uniref:PACE efflux transporter n=1 Tax=Thalassomonas haliotis TaxID=485448 RepID=A0ABY7VKK1_9GAMM|nr:PACE efflux transporter [Thalassomonas haliotis]WDE13942.1 PACE efflux transporter [Thalassomonas haliotis]